MSRSAHGLLRAAFVLIPLSCVFQDGVDDSQAGLTSWENIALPTQTGVFTASFDAVPSASNEDVVVGLSRGPAAAYTDLAAIVRFGIGGVIDVRNGAGYTAATSVSNVAGKSYHVRMQVDVPAKKYTVRITPAGGSEVVLAQDAAFRDSQSTVTSLANRAKFGELGDVTITNFTIDASPPTVTLTSPSNGQSVVVGTPVQLAAQASDDVGVTRVELYVGTTRQCTLTAAPYSCSFTPTTAGNFAIQAKAYDAAGAVATSATATLLVTATPTWQNVAFATQTGTFTAAFDAVPTQTPEDVVIGLSSAPAAAYTDLAAIVRFGTSGVIEVRNGAAYGAAAAVSYTTGTSYHVRMVVNVAARTYSVYVTPQGQAEITLAQSYAFRDSQSTVTSLANRAKIGDPGDVMISGFTITAAGDTTAPSAPTNLTATAVSSSQINLSWTASTDNVGVTGYRVFRNGTQIAAPTTTSYSNIGLTAATAYSYTVKAVDAAGNVSASSNTASATTPGSSANCTTGVWNNLEACGWPGPTNTGPDMTQCPGGLTASGAMVITTPGTVVSCRNITGGIQVRAQNVTIKNSKVSYDGGGAGGSGVININDGASATVDHVELNGLNHTHSCIWDEGVKGSALAYSMVAKNVNCYGVNDGIFSWWWPNDANLGAGSDFIIQDSYFHDFTEGAANGHIDGYQTEGAANGSITHNTYKIARVPGDVSVSGGGLNGAISIWDDFNQSSPTGRVATNIVVSNNLIAGGGFAAYSEDYSGPNGIAAENVANSAVGGNSLTNIRWLNNKFSKLFSSCVGQYGIWFYRGGWPPYYGGPTDLWNQGGSLRSGNVVIETGENVDRGGPAGCEGANTSPAAP